MCHNTPDSLTLSYDIVIFSIIPSFDLLKLDTKLFFFSSSLFSFTRCLLPPTHPRSSNYPVSSETRYTSLYSHILPRKIFILSQRSGILFWRSKRTPPPFRTSRSLSRRMPRSQQYQKHVDNYIGRLYQYS